MIATAKPSPTTQAACHPYEPFLHMLSTIKRRARFAFKGLDPEARADAVEEVVAHAFCTFARLVELGKANLAYATPLSDYGIRQFRAGRRVGGQLNVHDATGMHCQLIKGVRVERLDGFDDDEEEWREILLEDRHAGPAETAASRIDFAEWLRSLSRRNRKVATTLASGETTKSVARRFRVSSSRISQIRRELFDAWNRFQGEPEGPAAVA